MSITRVLSFHVRQIICHFLPVVSSLTNNKSRNNVPYTHRLSQTIAGLSARAVALRFKTVPVVLIEYRNAEHHQSRLLNNKESEKLP